MDLKSHIRMIPERSDEAIKVTDRQCEICFEDSGKYTCPRCNVFYCSVGCFKHTKHSGCSESFYKDCLIQEMKQSRASDKEKMRIMRMLKEFEEQNIVADSEFVSLEERLENINLDNSDEVWEKLTSDEQAEFTKRLQNGNLIKGWQPWWQYHDTSLVSEMDTSTIDSKCANTLMPCCKITVPQLSTLLRGRNPSPLVRNNIVDVLYSYAYFCFVYNGNVQDFACEIAHDVISASRFLSHAITVQTCSEAIHGAVESCTKHQDGVNTIVGLDTIVQVYHIMLGPNKDNPHLYATACLSELHLICNKLRKLLKKQHQSSDLQPSCVFKTMKSLEFLIAWVNDNKSDLLSVSVEVLKIYRDKKSFISEHEHHKGNVEKIRNEVQKQEKNKVLIQEIR